MVHQQKLASILGSMPNLLSRHRRKNRCLVAFVITFVMSAAQILTYVNNKQPEVSDSLHPCPLHVNGSMPSALQSPVVHRELFGLSDIQTP